MNKNSKLKLVQDLVSQGKLEEAIELLKNNIKDQNQISLLSNRYQELNKKIRLNTVGEVEANIERNKITSAVLAMAEGHNLKSNSFNDKHKTIQDPKITTNSNKVTYSIVITTIIAACAVFTLIQNNLENNQDNLDKNKPEQQQQFDGQTKPKEDKSNSENEASPSNHQTKKLKNPIVNSKILNEIIKYKGMPIENAYFIVENCKSCNSSISNERGEVSAKIPLQVYDSKIRYNFQVYSQDSLLYYKKMRFTSIDLNRY